MTGHLLIINDTEPMLYRFQDMFRVDLDPSSKSESYILEIGVEISYRHPEAPHAALIPVRETVFLNSISATDPLFPLVKMLYLNQRQFKNSFRDRMHKFMQDWTGLKEKEFRGWGDPQEHEDKSGSP